MADVFLSYAHADRQKAQELARTLTSCGWTVFWDRVIRSGPRYRDVIAGELESAKCVVVLWSSTSIKSDWVIDEAEEARVSGRLVPAVIDGVKPPHGFRGLQTASLVESTSDDAGAELDLLLTGIEAHVPRRAAIETAAAPAAATRAVNMVKDQSAPLMAKEPERGGQPRDEPIDVERPAAQLTNDTPPSTRARSAPISPTDTERAPIAVTTEQAKRRGSRRDQTAVSPPRAVARHDETPGPTFDLPSKQTSYSSDAAHIARVAIAKTFDRDPRVLGLAVMALLLAGIIVIVMFNNSTIPADLGFDPRGVVMMEVGLPSAKYKTGSEVTNGFNALLQRVRAYPGVVDVAAVDIAPTEDVTINSSIAIGNSAIRTRSARVIGNYFAVLRMPPLLGRVFGPSEPSPVVVISRSRMNNDPAVLGRSATVRNGDATTTATVIGVVDDVRYRAAGGSTLEAHIWVPATQDPVQRMTILARMSVAEPLRQGTDALRQALSAFDAQLPTPRVDDLEAVVRASMSQPRFGTLTIALLSLLAIALVLLTAYAGHRYFVGTTRVV